MLILKDVYSEQRESISEILKSTLETITHYKGLLVFFKGGNRGLGNDNILSVLKQNACL